VDSDCGQRGLFCAKSGVCAAPVAAGGACDDARPCGFATSCVGQTKTAAGTCQSVGTSAGASCDDKKVAGPGCQANAGLYCTIDGMCAAESLASPPAACGRLVVDAGADDGGDAGKKEPFSIAVCAAGAVCEPAAATDGTCAAPAGDGQPCDRVNGPPCLAPARCVVASDAQTAGTCVLPGAASCQ
jgi:hypothetical protein